MTTTPDDVAIGIPLQPSRYWRMHAAPSFRLHHNRVRWPRFLHRVAEDSARRTRAAMARLGCALPPPIDIYVRCIRPRKGDPCAAYVPSPAGPAIALNLHNPYPFHKANPYFWARVEALLVHEWVHAAIDAHCRGQPLPRWLDEGLAILLGRACAPPDAVDRPVSVYAALVRRLVARVGWEGLMDRLPRLARSGSVSGALTRAFGGLSFEQLAHEVSAPVGPLSRLPRRLVGERIVAGALSNPRTRPTELAVCLRLDASLSGRPELSAVASGARARTLVARGVEAGIAIVRDARLAGALTIGREIGDEIGDAELAGRVLSARRTRVDPFERPVVLRRAYRVRGLRLVVGLDRGMSYRLGPARRPGPPLRPSTDAHVRAASISRPGEPLMLG